MNEYNGIRVNVYKIVKLARRKQLQIGGGGGTDGGGHRYENFRAQMRNLLRLRYEKDGGKDMEIIWRTHVETMRGGGGHGCENDRRGVTSVEII